MQFRILAVPAVLAALALAGCGSSTTTTATPASNAAPASTQTYDMTGMASYIKTTMEQRVTNPSGPYYIAGAHVKDVSCLQSGAQTAACLLTWNDGTQVSLAVSISADGSSYVWHED